MFEVKRQHTFQLSWKQEVIWVAMWAKLQLRIRLRASRIKLNRTENKTFLVSGFLTEQVKRKTAQRQTM